jgi:hypothetical protein
MGEEFYSSIKLITGEEIFSLVSVDENDGDPVLVLQNPVVMKLAHTPNGSILRIKPWLEVPGDDFFIVKLDRIVTMTEVKDKNVIKMYNRYLEDDDSDIDVFTTKDTYNYKSELTNKMGYISTVDDARKSLENIFRKDLKDNKES